MSKIPYTKSPPGTFYFDDEFSMNIGNRGPFKISVPLEIPVKRRVNGKEIEFSEAYIMEGRENKFLIKGLLIYSFTKGFLHTDGYEEEIKIIIKDGIYFADNKNFRSKLEREAREENKREPTKADIEYAEKLLENMTLK